MPFSLQLSFAHKVALLVTLPVTGFLLYLLLRKDEDDYEPPPRQVVTSRHRVIELSVPQHAAGAIIGPQGSQIKMIQDSTGARVNFKDDAESRGEERVVLVRGTDEQAQQAEVMIRKIISDIPPVIEEVFYVHQRVLGRIIGKSGETVRNIQRMTKTRVKIDRNPTKNEMKEIMIRGIATNVSNAKGMIEEKIEEDDVFRAKMSVNAANRSSRSAGQARGNVNSGNHQRTPNVDTGAANGEASVTPVPQGQQSEWPKQCQDFFEVYVSAVEHPGHFWVQVVSPESVRLDRLIDHMTKYYSVQAKMHNSATYSVGDIVAAPFEEDRSFYRARVEEIQGDKVDLYFLDFGDSEFVDKSEVFPLRSDHLNLPFQAFECCLADVEPVGEEWSEEAILLFEELVHVAKWKVIMCRSVAFTDTECGNVPSVQIVDTNLTQDRDIAKELVSRGLARYTEPSLSKTPAAPSTQVGKCQSGKNQNQIWQGKESSLVVLHLTEEELCYFHSLDSLTMTSDPYMGYNMDHDKMTANNDMETESNRKGFMDSLYNLDSFIDLLTSVKNEPDEKVGEGNLCEMEGSESKAGDWMNDNELAGVDNEESEINGILKENMDNRNKPSLDKSSSKSSSCYGNIHDRKHRFLENNGNFTNVNESNLLSLDVFGDGNDISETQSPDSINKYNDIQVHLHNQKFEESECVVLVSKACNGDASGVDLLETTKIRQDSPSSDLQTNSVDLLQSLSVNKCTPEDASSSKAFNENICELCCDPSKSVLQTKDDGAIPRDYIPNVEDTDTIVQNQSSESICDIALNFGDNSQGLNEDFCELLCSSSKFVSDAQQNECIDGDAMKQDSPDIELIEEQIQSQSKVDLSGTEFEFAGKFEKLNQSFCESISSKSVSESCGILDCEEAWSNIDAVEILEESHPEYNIDEVGCTCEDNLSSSQEAPFVNTSHGVAQSSNTDVISNTHSDKYEQRQSFDKGFVSESNSHIVLFVDDLMQHVIDDVFQICEDIVKENESDMWDRLHSVDLGMGVHSNCDIIQVSEDFTRFIEDLFTEKQIHSVMDKQETSSESSYSEGEIDLDRACLESMKVELDSQDCVEKDFLIFQQTNVDVEKTEVNLPSQSRASQHGQSGIVFVEKGFQATSPSNVSVLMPVESKDPDIGVKVVHCSGLSGAEVPQGLHVDTDCVKSTKETDGSVSEHQREAGNSNLAGETDIISTNVDYDNHSELDVGNISSLDSRDPGQYTIAIGQGVISSDKHNIAGCKSTSDVTEDSDVMTIGFYNPLIVSGKPTSSVDKTVDYSNDEQDIDKDSLYSNDSLNAEDLESSDSICIYNDYDSAPVIDCGTDCNEAAVNFGENQREPDRLDTIQPVFCSPCQSLGQDESSVQNICHLSGVMYDSLEDSVEGELKHHDSLESHLVRPDILSECGDVSKDFNSNLEDFLNENQVDQLHQSTCSSSQHHSEMEDSLEELNDQKNKLPIQDKGDIDETGVQDISTSEQLAQGEHFVLPRTKHKHLHLFESDSLMDSIEMQRTSAISSDLQSLGNDNSSEYLQDTLQVSCVDDLDSSIVFEACGQYMDTEPEVSEDMVNAGASSYSVKNYDEKSNNSDIVNTKSNCIMLLSSSVATESSIGGIHIDSDKLDHDIGHEISKSTTATDNGEETEQTVLSFENSQSAILGDSIHDSLEDSIEMVRGDIQFMDESDEDDLRSVQPVRCSTPLVSAAATDPCLVQLMAMEEGNLNSNNNNGNNQEESSSGSMSENEAQQCPSLSDNHSHVTIEYECTGLSEEADLCFCTLFEYGRKEETSCIEGESLGCDNKLVSQRESEVSSGQYCGLMKVSKSALKRWRHLKECPNRARRSVNFSEVVTIQEFCDDNDCSDFEGRTYTMIDHMATALSHDHEEIQGRTITLATFDEDETAF